MRKNNKYTGEFKEMVVRKYLSGQNGGLITVAKIYGVRNVSQLKKWVKNIVKTQQVYTERLAEEKNYL
ncbi:transposase [Lactococcus lactis]|uniref:transposase n=1 Tax=Lactococcus lactis TaxID=1358 RepID=UPI002890D9A9|nr:transposase [Lactococcus lactis]MDT2885578.1 transposase [Lactococcus lactis]MDT2929326.1 transposase [Lactococcus lactis]